MQHLKKKTKICECSSSVVLTLEYPNFYMIVKEY